MIFFRIRGASALLMLALLCAIPSVRAQSPPAKPPAAAPEQRAGVARFRNRVEAVLAEARAQKAYFGMLVEDAETGEILYDLNADRSFTPASNTKLFTTAIAMATLGPEYRFHTTIETRGTLDADGRLNGDLVFVGRGDPDLSNRKFPYAGKVEREGPADKVLEEMADAVVAKGVKEIAGDIVADDSYFPYDPYPAGWEVGDLYFSFGAPVSAIALDDNTIAIEVRPGSQVGASAQVDIEPWDGHGSIECQITTGPADSKVQFEVVRQPGPLPTLLRGLIPFGHEPVKLDLAMDEPAVYTARVLKQLLETRGVWVTGQARSHHALLPSSVGLPEATAEAPKSLKEDSLVLAEHVSPPLLEIIRVLHKVSQNLHSEMLLRTVAREKTGVGSTDAGLKVEQEFLKSIGIAEGEVVLGDGSGLSRNNLVTPRATVALLRWIATQPWGEAYISTLPVAGRDGTLETRLKNTPAANRIEAKTGAHEHVRAMSGFATTLRGERLVFSLFENNSPLNGHDAVASLDSIGLAMVEELGAASRPPTPQPRRRK
jgi:serine-type D-Ala-D-Ala carboxypeptidase/endopeptidase (penicillin-binding protein 4)